VANRFALAALMGASTWACDPIYEACTHVRRCSDEDPLVGVAVTVFYSDGAVLTKGHTNPHGEFCYGDMGSTEPPETIRMRFSKPGYETLNHTFRNADEDLPWVCLEAECADASCDGAAGAGGAPLSEI